MEGLRHARIVPERGRVETDVSVEGEEPLLQPEDRVAASRALITRVASA